MVLVYYYYYEKNQYYIFIFLGRKSIDFFFFLCELSSNMVYRLFFFPICAHGGMNVKSKKKYHKEKVYQAKVILKNYKFSKGYHVKPI
jgi:hypothetical protein